VNRVDAVILNKNAPAAVKRSGRSYQLTYLVVAGAAAFFFFLLVLCFLVAGFAASAAGAAAAGASAAIGAAAFGMSAAIAAAARPKVNNAEVIKVPDLFMSSPNGVINKQSKEYARSIDFPRDEDHFTNLQGR
jgi:hypothetical protein